MNFQNRANVPGQRTFLKDQLITNEDLLSFKSNLIEEIKTIFKELRDHEGRKWLRSVDVCRKIGVSPATLQNFRIKGLLPFNKVGGVIFYSKEDVDAMIESNRIDNSLQH